MSFSQDRDRCEVTEIMTPKSVHLCVEVDIFDKLEEFLASSSQLIFMFHVSLIL